MIDSEVTSFTVTIGGPVEVKWESFDGSEERRITEKSQIVAFSGRTYLDEESGEPLELSVYLQDGSDTQHLYALGVRGGILKYEYHERNDALWLIVEYSSPRRLNDAELESLVRFTEGQWYDGAGANFAGDLADENSGTGPLGHPTRVHISQSP